METTVSGPLVELLARADLASKRTGKSYAALRARGCETELRSLETLLEAPGVRLPATPKQVG